jgi:hypothetical protein
VFGIFGGQGERSGVVVSWFLLLDYQFGFSASRSIGLGLPVVLSPFAQSLQRADSNMTIWCKKLVVF